MMNKLRIMKNTFKQSFKSMWRNRGMGIASVSSISAVLVILGFILILVMSINSLVVDVQSKFDKIEIFLAEDISAESREEIEEYAKNEEKITSIEYVSQEDAIESMKKEWEEEAYLLEGISKETLPDSYVVEVEEIEETENIVNAIGGIVGVEKVKYHREIIDKLTTLAGYIRTGGILIIAVLIAISVFIISNTIKLTVFSRKREINIMKYIGATNSYIKTPFILEGVLFGITAALISIVIVYFGYEYLFESINEKLYMLFTVILVPPEAILKDITIVFLAIGSGIGALGSMVSMRKHLNV